MSEECSCRGDEQVGQYGVFWCERHRVWKTPHWRELCRTRAEFRIAWRAGRGPGQLTPTGPLVEFVPADGLGDTIAKWLSAVGITEDNYKRVKEMFGLPPTCGCAGRREWLNKVGRWLKGEGNGN